MLTESLLEQLMFKLECSEECGATLTHKAALRELQDDLEHFVKRAGRDKMKASAKRDLMHLRLHLAELGVYEAKTKDQLSHVVVSHGRPYDFKIGGKFYVFVGWGD